MTKKPIIVIAAAYAVCAQLYIAPSFAEPKDTSRTWGDPAISKAGTKSSKPAAEVPKASAGEAAKPVASKPADKASEKPVEASSSKAPAPAQAAAPAASATAPTTAPLETGAVPPPARQATASGDWFIECGPDAAKPACTLRQLVADAKKRRIVEMRATTVGKTAFLEVIVPTGISIPYGVSVDVATDKKLPAQLVDCGVAGCRAVLLLDADNVKALNTAKMLAVTFQDSKSGKVISISGSPKGFEAGIVKVIGAS